MNYLALTNPKKDHKLNASTYKAMKAVKPIGFSKKTVVAPLYVSPFMYTLAGQAGCAVHGGAVLRGPWGGGCAGGMC